MIPLWAQLAGAAGAIASITSASTQIVRMLRVRTASGISPITWILLSVTSLSWFAYGISVRSPQQIIANGSWVILTIPLTWFMLSERSLPVRLGGQVVVALSLAVLLGLGLVNANIPAYIGMPASILVNLPQIRYTIRHGRGPGISVTAWVFLTTSSYLWFTYGIGADEVPVVINSGIAAILGTITVIALLVRPIPAQVSVDEAAGDADLVAGGVDDMKETFTPRRV